MFEEKIKSFVERIDTMRDSIFTEEATKTSLIMPFFSLLGYDVFNPTEFVPEYVADVGIKKGEKVDYAIVINGQPTILVEAKSVNQQLEKHDSQLFRYFGVSTAKFAILTNGIIYKFYTDLEEPNKMDITPFMTIDLCNLRDSDIVELKKFEKASFDIENIINTASDLKYCSLIKQFLKDQFSNPSDDFVKLVLSSDIYEGRFTQAILDKFKPIVRKSISLYLNDLVNDKIKNALNLDTSKSEPNVNAPNNEADSPENDISGIVTTAEELQSFYIIKSILGNELDLNRITYKDTASYFTVFLDGKVTRWISRIYLKEHIKYLVIPEGDELKKYVIESINDIYGLATVLKERAKSIS